ncbi:MAG: tRNA modification GTPase [Gammaproteobacteria bacterium]|nr:tRNA modification GTPase [Gammaproteobacteria bacterium]
MVKAALMVLALLAVTACSGIRTTDHSYSAHAENFNILFLQIPGGDTQQRAMELVPEGSDIVTMTSTPKDTSSLIGFINRLLGIDITFINGATGKE